MLGAPTKHDFPYRDVALSTSSPLHSSSGLPYMLALLSLTIFLTGCTTLKVMTYEGIARDRWQHPEEVVESLNIERGDVVADIGSGSGYFTMPLAGAVGPEGTVYAADIDEGLNEYLEERLERANYQNVEVILAQPEDPNLPETDIDLIFMCNTYHYLDDPTSYFSTVREYTRERGRVAIIDYDGSKWRHFLTGHWSDPKDVIQDLEAANYELVSEFDFLDRQYFLVFSE